MATDLDQLDPDGDVILVVEQSKFLVSSKVLGLASPVFAALFSRKFSEGLKLVENSRPEITLKDDDPDAMRTILRVLHFKDPDDGYGEDAKQLAVLAIHCDKYNCAKPLRSKIENWIGRFDDDELETEQFGFLLLAAHFARDPESFEWVSLEAQKSLPPDFSFKREEHEILCLLPDKIIDDLREKINQTLQILHNTIQSVEGSLAKSRKIFAMPGFTCCAWNYTPKDKTCKICGKDFDNTNKNTNKQCTRELRIAEYFEILRKSNLWPSVKIPKSISCLDLVTRISDIDEHISHTCGKGDKCPLVVELEALEENAEEILDEAKGFDLYPLHGGAFDWTAVEEY